MQKKLISILVLAAAYILTITMPITVEALGVYTAGSNGVDISYPNCGSSIPRTAFGIVGVTGGLFYSYNNCLSAQAAKFSNLSLYSNTGWNDQSSRINPNNPKLCSVGDANCLAYNYGYNAASDAMNYAASQGVSSPTWWLDVEKSNTWNSDTTQNRNSLQGSYDALKAGGAITVGTYSTTAQWQTITGNWQNYWPNWGATTWTTAKQAAKYCYGHQFNGGPTYLIQYTGRSLDQDYAC